MKKVFSLIFFVWVAMLIAPPCVNAGTFLGTFCFQVTSIGDILVMNVEYTVGDGNFTTLTVTGMNATQCRVMSGGGVLVGNTVKLFMGETACASPIYLGQLHSIVIDLGTISGTDDIILYKNDGTHTLFSGVPISRVACP